MKTITLCLGFNKNAEQAVNTYVSLFNSVFGNSEVLDTSRFGEKEIEELKKVPEMAEDIMPGPAGAVKTIRFTLNGQEVVAFNGGASVRGNERAARRLLPDRGQGPRRGDRHRRTAPACALGLPHGDPAGPGDSRPGDGLDEPQRPAPHRTRPRSTGPPSRKLVALGSLHNVSIAEWEPIMKFICLGYSDEKLWDAMSDSEREAVIEECFAYDDTLRRGGHWTGVGEALQCSRAAKTLRSKGGKVIVTDGPFAETKEQLGGLGVIEARDLDHAVELMVNHPALRFGPIEIRPIDGELTERCQSKSDDASAQAQGMKFVCLSYGDENTWNAMSNNEREGLIEECMAYDAVLRKYGQSVGGVALQSVRTAKTLRSRGGKVLVTDGPYAETKEQVGGVAINKFTDIDCAVEAWLKHPCLRVGDVLEIRPADEEFNARIAARDALVARH